jgi:D-alanyl-D-alanine carboxypeptidase
MMCLLLGVLVLAGGLGAVIAIDRIWFSSGGTQISYTPPPYAPRGPYQQQQLDSLVSGHSWIAPGATAYVAGPTGIWVGSAGLANVKTRAPMQPDARLRLESISKLWTATVILKLVGKGRMRLDDTVARWLPGLLPNGNQITVSELLSMTSGMIDTNDLLDAPQDYAAEIKDPALRAKLLAVARDPAYAFPARLWVQFAAALPPVTPPSGPYRPYHYSNIGYIVAGMIAERVSGVSLSTLYRRDIIDPLHLTTAAYDPNPNITGPHAHGYLIPDNGPLTDTTTWTQGLGANGGIVSDAADEAHFLQALIRGEILKPAQLTALKKDYSMGYGLGVTIQSNGCSNAPGIAYGHNGGGLASQNSVQISPDGNRVAVLLTNGHTIDDTGSATLRGTTTVFNTLQRIYCSAP